jgi:hypothetical protein
VKGWLGAICCALPSAMLCGLAADETASFLPKFNVWQRLIAG